MLDPDTIHDDSWSEHLVSLLQRNRISTVEVADALGKTGVQEGIDAFNGGHYAAGKVHYVYTHSESNWPLHEQISDVPERTVLFVDVFDCGDRAVLGDIMAKFVFIYKRVDALVINGLARDAHRLRKENYPVWLRGVTPLGCTNSPVELEDSIEQRIEARRKYFEGSIMVCDDSGTTLIDSSRVNAETARRLEFIELQEDIWYFCIDTLKWSTYETICLKRYLLEKETLPIELRQKLKEFDL